MIITVSHTISMGHRLPSYDGICSSPHGHNITVEAVIATWGGFLDFKNIDSHLRDILKDFDHAMVLWEHDPLLPVLMKSWADPQQMHTFRTVALNVEPTTEAIASHVFNVLSERFFERVQSVTVHETAKYAATAITTDPRVHRVYRTGL